MNSLIPIPQPLSALIKDGNACPSGTVALLAGCISLMVTQATEVNKNKSLITERCQLRVVNEINTSL